MTTVTEFTILELPNELLVKILKDGYNAYILGLPDLFTLRGACRRLRDTSGYVLDWIDHDHPCYNDHIGSMMRLRKIITSHALKALEYAHVNNPFVTIDIDFILAMPHFIQIYHETMTRIANFIHMDADITMTLIKRLCDSPRMGNRDAFSSKRKIGVFDGVMKKIMEGRFDEKWLPLLDFIMRRFDFNRTIHHKTYMEWFINRGSLETTRILRDTSSDPVPVHIMLRALKRFPGFTIDKFDIMMDGPIILDTISVMRTINRISNDDSFYTIRHAVEWTVKRPEFDHSIARDFLSKRKKQFEELNALIAA